MKFSKLLHKGSEIKETNKIIKILEQEGFQWLINAETEEANIEIKKNTIIWNSGYFNGYWYYGIWKDGNFHGTWENGIFEDGTFDGDFISGIKSSP